MTLTFTHAGPSITQQEIEQKAQDLGIVLPEDYQRFLLKYNGGKPEYSYFYIKDAQKQDISFYNLRSIKAFYSLESIQVLEEDTPKEFVIIGDDGHMNTIVLGHMPPYTNQVFYWDNEDRVDYDEEGNLPPPTMDNMYWIADSFSDFLALLIYDPDETVLDRLFKKKDIQGLMNYFEGPDYDPMRLPDKGQKDLRRVATVGSVGLFKVLVSKGVDALQNPENWYFAARGNHVNLMKYLSEKGYKGNEGFGGFRGAALEGNLEAVEYILSLGADPTEELLEEFHIEDKTLLGVVKFRMNHPNFSAKRESFQKIHALLEPYFKGKS